MKSSSEFPKVLLCCEKVDFRKWIDGLCAVVQYEIKRKPTEKILFVFISRCRSKMKALYWDDDTGFAVWYKRLEKGKFPVPKKEKVLEITSKQFELFLDGYDILKLKPHKKISEIKIC